MYTDPVALRGAVSLIRLDWILHAGFPSCQLGAFFRADSVLNGRDCMGALYLRISGRFLGVGFPGSGVPEERHGASFVP